MTEKEFSHEMRAVAQLQIVADEQLKKGYELHRKANQRANELLDRAYREKYGRLDKA